MNHLEFITQSVAAYPDHCVMFKDAINVKASPHIALFTCYGAWVGPYGVYLMNGEGEWHGPLLAEQGNGELMINSIYQRMKILELNGSAVAN